MTEETGHDLDYITHTRLTLEDIYTSQRSDHSVYWVYINYKYIIILNQYK